MLSGPFVAIDCFAGAGGLSLGLHLAGFDVRAAFDNSPDAVKTYSANLSKPILCEDVEKVKGSHLLELAGSERGKIALVAGGPPCQGFSIQRRGSDYDDRNQLIFEFLRIVDETLPEMFLMENVSGIQGKRGSEFLKQFNKEAYAIGYNLSIKVLDAADYGVPQHRKRAFIIGERVDKLLTFKYPEAVLSNTERKTVRDAIGDLPSPLNDPENAKSFLNHEADRISDLNRLRISYVPQGGGREHIPEHLRLPCHQVSVEKAGHRQVYGRLHWDYPAGTITTKCNSFTRGKFAHPEEHRNITMREAARLQGFPDNFHFLGDKVAVAHQIGNAVPPPLAFALGRSIINSLEARGRLETSPILTQMELSI